MVLCARLTIEFQGYWIAGGGKAGAGVDAVTERDDCGCPAMPTSQVKGTLRETAARLWPKDKVAELFGSAKVPSPVAFVGQARLPEDVRRWFHSNGDARRLLFRHLSATRIDENGVADDRTLRRIEVAVPLTLEAIIHWRASRSPDPNWVERLDDVCAATLAFGKGKADGLGRAIACCAGLTEVPR